MISYRGRLFRPEGAVHGGDVGPDTVFKYNQRGRVLLASYAGGNIEFGSIVGTIDARGGLDFIYHHCTRDHILRAGKCVSVPEILDNGRLRLHERWTWTLGAEGAGESTLIEI